MWEHGITEVKHQKTEEVIHRIPYIKWIGNFDTWWLETTEKLLERLGFPAKPNLVDATNQLIEVLRVDAWFLIVSLHGDEKRFWRVMKAFQPDLPDLLRSLYKASVIELEAPTETFDSSLLDFLEGKVTKKMIDWAVGQVLRSHPKKFKPQEVREAVLKRWFPGGVS